MKYISYLITGFLLSLSTTLFIPTYVEARLLLPLDQDTELPKFIGDLSYVNFGSIWQDAVELFTLESNNEYTNYVCSRMIENCIEGDLTKPEGRISYQGN